MEDIRKCYKWVDSYLVESTAAKRNAIRVLIVEGKLSSRRSVESYVREWHAHNWLYNHGLFIDRTKDTDFDSHESIFRLIGYWFIWIFTKKRP
jgi:hypothetical protein